MKTRRLIFRAATLVLAAALGACTLLEMPMAEETPFQKPNILTLVTTLSPMDGTETRSVMTDNGTTISTGWEVGDKIWVNYDDTGDNNLVAKGTVTAVDGDGKATITVDLVDPKDASIIVFGFPYDHWTEAKDVRIDQLGTLDDINQNHAAISGSGTLTVVGSVVTLPTDVSMSQDMCIWKLAFSVGGANITNTITSLNISFGPYDDYMISPNAQSVIYAALYPVDGGNITFTAATPTGIYSFSATGITLANGMFYRSYVPLTAAAASDTYRVFTSRTNYSDVAIPGGATTVTSGTTTWAAGTYVVSSDVTIDSDITLSGDANLILKDGAELTVHGCIFGGADYEHGFVHKLNIYGQKMGTGKLTVDYSGAHSLGVMTASELNIHGGIITVGGTGVWQGLEPNLFNVYHGTINATAGMNAIIPMGNTHIYGGIINAHSTTTMYGGSTALLLPNGGSTLTISGGTITAISDEASGIETTDDLVISGGTISAQGGPMMEGIMVYGTCTISGGYVTARAGERGIALEGVITISGGDVTAIGGDAVVDSDGDGMAGVDGTLTMTGGKLIATGGAKDGTGADGLGISGGSTINLTGVTMYEGDAANPATPAADQSACTKRYAIIR